MADESVAVVTGWKRWLALGVGFGAGAAIIVALIVGLILWQSSRPKPWVNQDITATFSTPLYNLDESFNIVGVQLEYIVQNKTLKDFTLSPDQSFLLQDAEALRRSLTGKYKISDQCFIPAKAKVKCEITVPNDFDTTDDVDGFVVFDNATRESIVFPKPTAPTPDERKKAIEDMRKMAEKYHDNPDLRYVTPPKHQP